MLYIFIVCAVAFTTLEVALQASCVSYSAKLTAKELAEADHNIMDWFKNRLTKKREVATQALSPIFPFVLIEMIIKYSTSYSDEFQQVAIGHLAHNYVDKQYRKTNETMLINIPLRHHADQPLELRYKDIFIACESLLNRPMRATDWHNNASHSWLQEKFKEFLSRTNGSNVVLPYGTTKEPLGAYFPTLQYFPLAVYWGHETTPCISITSVPILQDSPYGGYSHTIDDACYQILKEHGKCPDSINLEECDIICTTCNGKIKYPHGNCCWLLIYHSQISADSPFCSGKHPRCRTFRALRVFKKIQTTPTLRQVTDLTQ